MNQPARRSTSRRAFAVLGLLGVFFAVTPAAHADPPVAQAWWWVAQQEAVLLPAVGPVGQVTEMVPQQAGPQGVPDDGLYVAGSAAGEEAVATLRFFIPEGSQPQSLDLVFAAAPTGTPDIRLCAVTTQWTPVQRGTWDKRPEFECADDAPVGVVSGDGKGIRFDLSGRTLAGTVDFGLAPGVDETGAPATFQAAFEKPGADSLVLPADGSGDGSAAPTPSLDVGDTGGTPTVAELPQAPSAAGGFNLSPVATQAPSPTGTGGGTTEFAAPVGAPATLPMAPASSGNTLRTLGMVGLLGLAGFYAWLTGQESRPPTSLLAFGRGASGPVIDAEVLQ